MFDAPHFQSHDEARKYLENLRWGSEPVCPHCGTVGRAYATKKEGVWRCAEPTCRKDFSVTTKTVMESSHVRLHVWLRAFYLMASSKKGMSAHQLHRTLKVTYKTAWFLAHRIREAMRQGGLAPMGGDGGIVEADETYFGKYDTPRERKTKRYTKPTKSGKSGPGGKRAIVALVERGGSVRTFHVAVADKPTVDKIVKDNVDRETRYRDLTEEIRTNCSKWWTEPTSFIAFESSQSIETLMAKFKAKISPSHDLILMREMDTKSALITGQVQDQDIFELMPYLKKV